ncbi:Sir2 family NAD-dependent protein deacetylase [Paramesorhizobium deserti]|uniref:Sir2 family NAD-dependent protein deacetylase n=1 Tax=Paramesorhizobium deserti TaxID=1494590 RepID=A0A135HRQ7_9HYPH|nr:SIR2 family protein [Paramesorhizobium deserti]KXF75852.1 Sir2 family NAD-dependent protein deacetylase [Paramesorhizobium deserti]
MQSPLDELARSIRERRAILFVGAGVSMSVGLPSWQVLIEHMAKELQLDPERIGGRDANYQTIAEYYRLKLGSMESLRDWMKRHWQVSREKVAASAIHSLIVSLDVPIIYTTNYDRNLEVAFEIHGRDYVKVANARDVARVTPETTEIVKFHGDFDDETSLVLAETDYFERLSFDSPLDVKFRSDALRRTVLFIGYSMSDMNIRLLLHRLWSTWHRSGYESERPVSFIFMPNPNPVQEAVLSRWGITVLSEEKNDPGEALQVFLSKLKDRAQQSSVPSVPDRR